MLKIENLQKQHEINKHGREESTSTDNRKKENILNKNYNGQQQQMVTKVLCQFVITQSENKDYILSKEFCSQMIYQSSLLASQTKNYCTLILYIKYSTSLVTRY